MNEVLNGESKEQFMAAYALNMCTVSVSQIIDYNDVHILEQEYDAILNNINLERIPKDDALLKILSELLNTITFFKIYDIKEKQIEEKYQRKIKNAIWSAIPNLGVVVASGNPLVMGYSLITQIGSSYMNYRNVKANAQLERDDSSIELQITAIEQLNAIKRELFTTSWKMAEKYNFSDKYRLTENQIKQYNRILMDENDIRKFERLEVIKNQFKAYPPFWYFMGHTAHLLSISEKYNLDISNKEIFREKAQECFEYYYEKFIDCNILREDRITSAYALEYADFLLERKNYDIKKVEYLIDLAFEMSKNANDILQICAISYLKIGKSEKAKTIFKILVNEEYNTISNIRLLSKLYVSDYVELNNKNALLEYNLLENREESVYMYPMPKGKIDDVMLWEKYIDGQKQSLLISYQNVINAYIEKNTVLFNKVLCFDNEHYDSYYLDNDEAKEERIKDIKKSLKSLSKGDDYKQYLKNIGFRKKYLDILNKTVKGLEILSIFNNSQYKELLIRTISTRIIANRSDMLWYQRKMNRNEFKYQDYSDMCQMLSYESFTGKFFINLKIIIEKEIQKVNTFDLLEKFDDELQSFCENENIDMANYVKRYIEQISNEQQMVFNEEMLGKDMIDELALMKNIDSIVNHLNSIKDEMIDNTQNETKLILKSDTEDFNYYIKNVNFNKKDVTKIIAIIDDSSKSNIDMLLTTEEIILLKKGKEKTRSKYNEIELINDSNEMKLNLGFPNEYKNKNINIERLYRFFEEIVDMEM